MTVSQPMSEGADTLENRKAACVLVVEDDPDIRGLLVELLQHEGIHVRTAADGRAAIRCLREGERPRVILLDLMMPIMSGWEFRTEQQKDPSLAEIPVVVLTGDTSIQQKRHLIAADQYLIKPVDVEELLGVVRRYCARDIDG